MTLRQRLFAGALAILALATLPAHSQNFPGKGDDTTTSLGSFKIQIVTQFQPIVNGCPGFDPRTGIWTSPTLFDGTTLIGRSNVIADGSLADHQGVPVGSANTIVSENMLTAPPGFPCFGQAGCTSGPGTREVHTEVRKLDMTDGIPHLAVRAGTAYPEPAPSPNAIRISPGEVESHAGPQGGINGGPDFPASSFFDMFVKVDLPACGNLPLSTVMNNMPLIVKNSNLTQFPPRVVYLHDQSSIVPVFFIPGGPFAGQIFGYLVLAGHGVGFSNSQSDIDEFNSFMSQQPVSSCPSNSCAPPPPPQPSPTPVPQPSPSPAPNTN